jgi:uncharacterized protein YjbK
MPARAAAAGGTPGEPAALAPPSPGLPAGRPGEVEVKLRITDAASYAALARALVPTFRAAAEQENFFFDGARGELAARRVVLRVRLYNRGRATERATLTVKGKGAIVDGVSRADEEEEALAPALAARLAADPAALLALESPLMARVRAEHLAAPGAALRCLGSFVNERGDYAWRGLPLELDRTTYPWGTLHELECETAEPERARGMLEELLAEHGVAYRYSTKSKFANFVDRTLE